MAEQTLSNLLQEDRRFPPTEEGTAYANGKKDLYEAAEADFEGFWGEQARKYVTWSKDFTHGARLERTRRSPSGSSAASSTPRTTASTGTSRPATATGSPSTSWASPATPATSPTPSCRPRSRKAANALTGPRRRQGRPRHDLPADDPRGRRSRCSRAPGSAPPHSVVFGGFSADALRSRIDDAEAKVVITSDAGYRRGTAFAAQAGRRRGGLRRRARPSRRCWSSTAATSEVDWNDGRDVWWHEALEAASDERPPEQVRLRAPAVHPLHLRHHREAQGHPAHHRRLPDPGGLHEPRRPRRPPRRPTSTGARPTSAGSPATATSSTARWPTAPRRSCTRARPTPRTRAAGGRSSRSTRSRSSTPRRRRSARS